MNGETTIDEHGTNQRHRPTFGERKNKKKNVSAKQVVGLVAAAVMVTAAIAVPTAIHINKDNSFTVTVNYGIAGKTQNLKVEKGVTLKDITAPKIQGYYFAGYCSDEGLTNYLNEDTKLEETKEVYLSYVPIKYSFNNIPEGIVITNEEGEIVKDGLVFNQQIQIAYTVKQGNHLTNFTVKGAELVEDLGEVVNEDKSTTYTQKYTVKGFGLEDEKEVNLSVVFEQDINLFTVQFINDGQIYSIQNVAFDELTQKLENPTKEATKTTRYVFAGWSENSKATADDLEQLVDLNSYKVKSNSVLYAVYSEVAESYDVTISEGMEEYVEIQKLVNNKWEIVPSTTNFSYKDQIFIRFTCPAGWQLNKFLVKGITDVYNTTGLTKGSTKGNIQGKIENDIDITFQQSAIEYSIGALPSGVTATFISANSTIDSNHIVNEVLTSSSKVHYGDTIKISYNCTDTYGMNTFTVSGMSSSSSSGISTGYTTGYRQGTVTGNVSTTFSQKRVQVSVGKNYSSYGNVDKTSLYVPYYSTISYSGNIVTIRSADGAKVYTVTATGKEADNYYTYDFSSWSNASGTLNSTSSRTITANFTRNYINYTITYLAEDGSTLKTVTNAHYGNTVASYYSGSTPTKATVVAEDGVYCTLYPFSGWSEASVTGNLTVSPVFTETASTVVKLTETSSGWAVSGLNVTDVENVIIPDEFEGKAVVSINSSAFQNKTNIKSVIIGANVTSIGSSAFYYCSSLTSVNIPDSVTSIEDMAFYNCKNVTNLTIGTGLVSLGSAAFYQLENLTVINYNAIRLSSCRYSFTNVATLNDGLILNIGEGVVSLPNYLFNYRYASNASGYGESTKIKEVNLPTSIRLIGNDTFDSKYLTNITIKNKDIYNSITSDYACGGLVEYAEKIKVLASVDDGSNSFLSSKLDYKEEQDRYVVYYNDIEVADNGVKYRIKDNEAWVVGFVGDETDVLIESSCKGKPVVSIEKEAFYGKKVTCIEIPNTIKTIRNSAFYNCKELIKVHIPSSVIEIESGAFYGCSSLSEIMLDSLKIYKNLTSDDAFGNLLGVGLIRHEVRLKIHKEIDDSSNDFINSRYDWIESEGEYNVHYNKFETEGDWEYRIQENTCWISRYNGKESNVVVPASYKGKTITAIGDYAFSNNSVINSIKLPETITRFGKQAFMSCRNLAKINIPDTVTYIGTQAFGCTSITTVTLPEGLEFIGNSAFYDCTHLQELYYNAVNAKVEYNSWMYNFSNVGSINVVFGDKVETIPDNLFYVYRNGYNYAPQINNIVIGCGVTKIGDNAFYNCNSVTKIEYLGTFEQWLMIDIGSDFPSGYYNKLFINGESYNQARDKYFAGGEVVLPEGLETLSSEKLYNHAEITQLTLPTSLQNINNNALKDCSSLTRIDYLGTLEQWLAVDEDYDFKNYYDKLYINGVLYSEAMASYITGDVVLPDGVTKIGKYKFYTRSTITSITIPDSVTSIGSYAFANCTGLTSITIPDSITSIGTNAFYYCSGLTSITIPDSVTSIGTSAFYYCSGLTSITIPASVTSIGGSAFSGCSGLTAIYYKGTQEQFNTITGINNITSTATVYYYTEGCIHDESDKLWRLVDGVPSTELTITEWIIDKEPTYEETGHKHGTCSVCGETINKEIPKLEHYTITNDATNPWTETEGLLTSGGKGVNNAVSTYSIKAGTSAITVTYEYKVSSEQNYDKLTIKKGTEILVNGISGSTSYVSQTVTLQAGETLTFTYSKDSSGNNNDDCAYIKGLTITVVE